MKTVIVYNQKGGVGKTSTVANLMSECSARGLRVLGIDLDGQGNLSSFCGAQNFQKSVREWLLLEAEFEHVVVKTRYGDLVPADGRLQAELMHFAAIPAFVIRIKQLIHKIKNAYDIIFIDCPPAVNQVTVAAMVAADKILIPSEAEYFSAIGVGQIAETIEEVKPLNPSIEVIGIVLVKYQNRRLLTKALEEKLNDATKSLFGTSLFYAKIRYSVDVPASQACGSALRDYAPRSKAASDYADFTEEFLRRLNNETI